MKFNLYSIRDSKAGLHLAPWPARSDADAQRSITASMSDPLIRETPIFQNPGDFSLCVLGVFDDETGSIEPFPPRQIAPILALIPQESSPAQLPS
nr:MAG: nonstructural protein [Microvirus sp.]DAM31247.1 MAG TPA: DNA binding protein [Microviridae sp.]